MLTSLIMFLAIGQSSHADKPCEAKNTQTKYLKSVNEFAHRGITVDSPDRKLAADFAPTKKTDVATLERHYSATGDLLCGNGESEANLTITDDVITTAAHSVTSGRCVNGSPRNCTVTFTLDGQKLTYPIASLIKSGRPCPAPKGPFESGSDWAVLRLGARVDSRIKPYAISTTFAKKLVDETPVTVVAKSPDFPEKKDALSSHAQPRHYADCINKTTRSFDFARTGVTNCDVSPGSSGGGVFEPEEQITPGRGPVLVGVVAAINQGSLPGCPANLKRQSVGPYDEKCFNTQNTLISGDFKDTLVQIQNSTTGKIAPPDRPPPKTNEQNYQDL